MLLAPPSTLFPYTTLFRSPHCGAAVRDGGRCGAPDPIGRDAEHDPAHGREQPGEPEDARHEQTREALVHREGDRKSTRLNSSHTVISYAVFCLKKKTKHHA